MLTATTSVPTGSSVKLRSSWVERRQPNSSAAQFRGLRRDSWHHLQSKNNLNCQFGFMGILNQTSPLGLHFLGWATLWWSLWSSMELMITMELMTPFSLWQTLQKIQRRPGLARRSPTGWASEALRQHHFCRQQHPISNLKYSSKHLTQKLVGKPTRGHKEKPLCGDLITNEISTQNNTKGHHF